MSIRRLVENLALCAAGIAAIAMPAYALPTDYVDPFVGTDTVGHTYPAACVPFGMVQAGPDTGTMDWKYCSGYQYGDTNVLGFSQTHLNGTGCPDLGDVSVLPFSGDVRPMPMSGAFRKANEKAKPGYYATHLDADDVDVEIAAEKRGALYRFRYARGAAKILFNLPFAVAEEWTNPMTYDAWAEARAPRRLVGSLTRRGWIPNRRVAFAVAFDRDMTGFRRLPETVQGVPRYEIAFGDVKPGETVQMKIALSMTDVAAAERNLDAMAPGFDFEAVRAAADAAWNDVLSRLTCEGSETQKKNFYTAAYHLFQQPNDCSDALAPMKLTTLSLWDTFRAAQPLYTIVAPEIAAGTVDACLAHGRENGELPVMSYGGRALYCMVGNHSVPAIVDACLKGTWTGDAEAAYAAVKDTLTKEHPGKIKEQWDLYDRYGYYPFDLVYGESVSRTLECAYDDWCAAQMAKALGKAGDYAFFMKRAGYWKNVYDSGTGFMRGKDAKGGWRTPFDPYALGHGADTDNDFTEGNAYQYMWHVMQDVDGLVAAMGGRDEFVRKLDALFTASDEVKGERLVVDVTGLIGQYVHGNEPSHHVIYFYPQVGEPAKAAERIREVFDTFYFPKPDGLCGNEDCGQMSAWYLFSAMGFYPFNPCGGEYIIGAPQLPRVTLRIPTTNYQLPTTNSQLSSTNYQLPTTNYFTVVAKGLSKENKYVKSVTLNGKPITDWKIRHADIVAGGELVFEMTDKATSAGGWKAALPRPVYDAHPEFVALYDKAWEIAHTRIKELKGIPAPRYMDEALWDDRIWIWDTCFMVQFCKYLPKEFPGVESLENFYGVMLADKAAPLPRVTCDENTTGKRGATLDFMIHHPDNPPLFAWTEYKYALQTGDRARLERVYGEKRWLQRWFDLFEAFDPAAPQPHGSCCPVAAKRVEDGYHWKGCPNGMDNTPRGRTADWADSDVKECPNNPDLLWVDALAQQGLSALYLAKIATLLGRPDEAAAWQARYAKMREKANALYWDERDGVYYDILAKDRSKVRVLTPASFWPALAEMPTGAMMARLSAQLDDSATLGGDVPTPSVARNDVAFDPKGCYWRGGVWLPTSYMTVKALDAYGDYARARTVAEKILARMARTYSRFEPHTIWECYSPTEDKPATAKFGEWSRHDFCGWSALGPISLFIEDVIGIKEANAFENTLVCDFPAEIQGRQGVENYRFGDVTCSVVATTERIEVVSSSAFTLKADGKSFAVVPGLNAFDRR